MPLKSDPRRLPRRNHCQERPDFLFVAIHAGDVPDVRSLLLQQPRGPAADVQQVVVGLEVQLPGPHGVGRPVPEREISM